MSEVITGRISRIIFQSEGFIIAKLVTGTTVLGEMASPSMAVEYEFSGQWKENQKYGRQFAFDSYTSTSPRDPTAIGLYLRENCKWVGPHIARAILSAYGSDALAICKNDPERVADEISGITMERAYEMAEKLTEIEQDEKLQIDLKSLFVGVPIQKRALKQIIREWGGDAVSVIEKDPYVLPDTITGIGFATADILGQKLKIGPGDTRRVRGGLLHALRDAVRSGGHTHLPTEDAIDRTVDLLSCQRATVTGMINFCVEQGQLIRDRDGVKLYLPKLWEDEQDCIRRIARLMRAPVKQPPKMVLDGLADDQCRAVETCLQHNVSILTGPAGSGKSFAIKRAIDSLIGDGRQSKVRLAAPTGKAAKRMFEHTNYQAHTIHKLLEPASIRTKRGDLIFAFSRDENEPLELDTLILDETSMLDLTLFASVLRAMPNGARLILIGDVNQLPAVGAGNVLRDLIRSGVIPVAELTTIKRQNPGLLLRNAHAVIHGDDITVENGATDGDFYFLARTSKKTIQHEICNLVTNRIPQKYGFDPLADIQVISPFREKTELSCKAMNAALQDKLNGGGEPIGKTPFRIGDKVIQRKNDYELGIVNGDVGVILATEKVGSAWAIRVRFDNPAREVLIPMYGNELQLAYCLTCHSYQGSEAPAIIVPIHTSFGSLLMQRSWIYTAMTRAQKLCIVIGEMKAWRAAVARNVQARRFTALAEKLKESTKCQAITAGSES